MTRTKYNFDEIVNREGTNCEKYDSREQIFGNPDVIPMWVADTDFRTPDFIVKAVMERAKHEVYGYPTKPDSYYKSIQGWLERRHNWKVGTGEIQYTPNVVIGLATLILSLTKPGDKIIVQPPVYFPFFHVVEGNDREMVENQLINVQGHYRFDFDDLKSKIDDKTKILLLCNPHNPGGRVWSRDELEELGQICLGKNVLVISDEIHADLIFSGSMHVPFASISEDFANICITTMSASKTFNIAGLTSAFMVIQNRKYRKAYQKFMQATHISSGNFFGLVATEAAFKHGDNWLEQLMDYLQQNLKYITEFFELKIPKVKVMKPEGTYLLWLDISELGIGSQEAVKEIARAGVGLSPGYLFGKGGENFLRLNMGCPRSVLEQALPRIEQALAKY